jgi:hypothetical protein
LGLARHSGWTLHRFCGSYAIVEYLLSCLVF